jgi:hypothetical protein
MQSLKFVGPTIQPFASKLSPDLGKPAIPFLCMTPLFKAPSLGFRNISYTRPCRSIDDFFISNPDVDKDGKMTFPAVG